MRERQQIVQEQARLRDNLARVPANSDLQRRYLATLDKQESETRGDRHAPGRGRQGRRGRARGVAKLRRPAWLTWAE
mgnify:CR=1 FL=1